MSYFVLLMQYCTCVRTKPIAILVRESDYAVVTREFEAYVDEIMVATVKSAEKQRAETPDETSVS